MVKAAIKVLSDVKISTAINQLPVSNLEKKRFSYFFNDKLTGLYNEDYLKIILNNLDLNQYTCMHMLHLLNVPEYNKHHGWDKGNLLLKEFAGELLACFPQTLTFRAYGNDFAFISKGHLDVAAEAFSTFKCIAHTELEIEVHHVDLTAGKAYTIDKLERLELLTVDELEKR